MLTLQANPPGKATVVESGIVVLLPFTIFDVLFFPILCDLEFRDVVIARPYVCVWHWQSNVLGLTLVSRGDCRSCLPPSRFVSRLYFSYDKQRGNQLVHVITRLRKESFSNSHMRKEIHSVGVLSPSEAFHQSACDIQEGSSLMLSSSSVTFPFVSSVSVSRTRCNCLAVLCYNKATVVGFYFCLTRYEFIF